MVSWSTEDLRSVLITVHLKVPGFSVILALWIRVCLIALGHRSIVRITKDMYISLSISKIAQCYTNINEYVHPFLFSGLWVPGTILGSIIFSLYIFANLYFLCFFFLGIVNLKWDCNREQNLHLPFFYLIFVFK